MCVLCVHVSSDAPSALPCACVCACSCVVVCARMGVCVCVCVCMLMFFVGVCDVTTCLTECTSHRVHVSQSACLTEYGIHRPIGTEYVHLCM